MSTNVNEQRYVRLLANWLRRLAGKDVYLVLIGFVGLAGFLNPAFLGAANLSNLMSQSALLGILAIAQFIVVVSGGFDLSVAAVMALSSLVFASTVHMGAGTAAVLAVASGGACGLFNGLAITRGKVQPLLATLAMMGIARGLALSISERSILVNDPGIGMVRTFTFGIFTVPTIVWFIIAAIAIWAISVSRLALHVYAVGGNSVTARLAGVNVELVKMGVYVTSGLLSGLAGIILVIRSSSGVPLGGMGWELDTIAAVVIGGTSLFGGEGRLGRALAGVLIFKMIANTMNLAGLDPFYQDIVRAAVIIAAVGFSIWRQRLIGRRVLRGHV